MIVILERYQKAITGLKERGCTDEDILALLQSFDTQSGEIEDVYQSLSKPLSTVVGNGKGDIGKSMVSAAEDPNVLPMTSLTQFINKLENIVDTELETLRAYILENTTSKAKTLELAHFYDHVFKWAERVYKQRAGEPVESDAPDQAEDEEPEIPSLEDSVSLIEGRLSKHETEVDTLLDGLKEKAPASAVN